MGTQIASDSMASLTKGKISEKPTIKIAAAYKSKSHIKRIVNGML